MLCSFNRWKIIINLVLNNSNFQINKTRTFTAKTIDKTILTIILTIKVEITISHKEVTKILINIVAQWTITWIILTKIKTIQTITIIDRTTKTFRKGKTTKTIIIIVVVETLIIRIINSLTTTLIKIWIHNNSKIEKYKGINYFQINLLSSNK